MNPIPKVLNYLIPAKNIQFLCHRSRSLVKLKTLIMSASANQKAEQLAKNYLFESIFDFANALIIIFEAR